MGNIFLETYGFAKETKKNFLNKYGVMDTKDVVQGYHFWVNYFLDMCIDLIVYRGLPDTLPSEEISKRLIKNGYAIIFKHPVEGIVTCDGYLYDFDFYRRYRMYSVNNPYRTFWQKFTGSGKFIGKDGIVIYNTGVEKWMDLQHSDNLFYTTIRRYARMMADIECTLTSELILARMPFLMTAPDQQTVDSIRSAFKSMEMGDMAIIKDENFLQNVSSLKNKEMVVNYISELITNRRNILSMFYSEIGIYQPDSKRERMLVDEVEQGKNNEKTLIYSMLREQQRGVEQLNKMYGLNVSVNLNIAIYDENVLITEMTEVE